MKARTVPRIGGAKPPRKAATPRIRAAAPSKALAPIARPRKATVRIFVSYCHANAAAHEKLQIHLAQLRRDEIVTWFDGRMHAGDKLDAEVSGELRAANIFVALMSPEYIASHWCQLEYRRAMGRRARGLMRVVVVVVRPCDWKATGASELKVLPRDGRPVSAWRTVDDAFNDLTQGIRGAVRAVRAAMTEASKAKPSVSRRRSSPAKRPRSPDSHAWPSTAHPGKKTVTGKGPGRKRAGV